MFGKTKRQENSRAKRQNSGNKTLCKKSYILHGEIFDAGFLENTFGGFAEK
jgi:hypothetical protein